MEKIVATTVFESLASGVRLDVFRLLVKQGPQGLVAGEISTTLALPPTNLSFHLKALTQARLLTVTQEGRYLRYRANIPLVQELIEYLTSECCSGQPEKCMDLNAVTACPPAHYPKLEKSLTCPRLEHPVFNSRSLP